MKITKFYLNKASYIGIDESGKKINVEIDYWNNKYQLDHNNAELEIYASKLLNKKHRVNFVHKMLE